MATGFNDRIQLYLADEEPRRPLFAERMTHSPWRISPKQQNLPVVLSSCERPHSDRSTVCSSSSYGATDRSSGRQDSTSSAGTSISMPPWHPPTFLQQLAMRDYDYGYDLPCEFFFVGCNMRFHPAYYEEWISHTESHLCGFLPAKAICTFCDDDQATFFSDGDDKINWRNRMVHIGGHLQELTPFENIRPDFWVIEHMWECGIISKEDYQEALKGSERPHCDDTYPLDYETPEKSRQTEIASQVVYDMRDEERQRRKSKAHKQSSSHRHQNANQKPQVEHKKKR